MRRAALLLALTVLAGCAAPPPGPPPPPSPPGSQPTASPPGPDACGPRPAMAELTVVVHGATGSLRQAVFLRDGGWNFTGDRGATQATLSCAGPAWHAALDATAAATARGALEEGAWDELRLRFADGVVRVAGDFVLRNGTLQVNLTPDRVGADLDGEPVAIGHGERHGDPASLDDFAASWTGPVANATRSFAIAVNTSWNRGLAVQYRVAVDRGLWREEDGYRGPAGALAVRVVDPSGAPRRTVQADFPHASDDLGLGPLERGVWTVEVDTWSGRAPGEAEGEVLVQFRY